MRRIAVGLLILLGLVLVATVALWLARLPLAEWGMARWLQGRGLAGSADFVHLGRGRAELQGLDLAGQRAGRVVLEYALPELLGAGRIRRVEVEGLRFAADLTAEQPLGDLLGAFAGPGDGVGEQPPLPVLPPLVLRDAEIGLTTPRGPLRLRLEGSLEPADDLPDDARRLDLSMETLEGPVRLAGRASGVYQPGDGDGTALALSLQSVAGPPVQVSAEAAIEAGELDLSFTLQGDAPLLSGLATLPPVLQPAGGRVSLDGELRAAAAPLLAGEAGRLLSDPDSLHALDLAVRLEEAALSGRVSGLTLDGAVSLAEQGDGRRLQLQPLELAAASFDAGWLTQLGLPAPLALLLADGADLSLRAPEGTPPAVLLLGADTAQVQLDLAALLHLRAGGSIAATARGELALPEDLQALPAGLSGQLAGELALHGADLPGLGALERAETAYALELPAGALPAGELPAGGDGLVGASLALTAPLAVQGLQLPAGTVAGMPEGWRPLLGRPLDLALGAVEVGLKLTVREDGGMALALPRNLRLAAGEAVVEAELGGHLALSREGVLEEGALILHSLAARALPTPHCLLRTLSLSGRIEGGPLLARGQVQAVADLEGVALTQAVSADIVADLAAGLAWNGDTLALDLAAPGRLALSGFSGPLAAVERLELALADVVVRLGQAALAVTSEAALAPASLDLDGRGRKDDLTLSAERLLLELTQPDDGALQGSLRSEGLDARFAAAGLAVRDARLAARFDGPGLEVTLASARLTPTVEPSLLPPLTLSGTAALTGEAVRFTARGRGMQDALQAAASGRYDIGTGRGQADVTVQPVALGPGGLQPGDLHPALAALTRAAGQVSATGSLRFGERLDSTARLVLENVGFTVAGTTVTGLDLTLALDSLDPPASPPGQPFSVARVDFGAALTDLRGRLQLRRAGDGVALEIERMDADFLDGRLALEDAVIDPGASRYDLVLLVEQVDLQRLLALAEVEGVSGSGRLSGRIPVSVVNGQVAIDRGSLAALEPGVVAFRSDEAREALAQGGEQVELMLQALQDFHYRVLDLTVDKPAEGESHVFLKLEGANPEVLDGQPFVLNINLTSNTAPLLAALARGTEISDRLVQQLLEGGLGTSR